MFPTSWSDNLIIAVIDSRSVMTDIDERGHGSIEMKTMRALKKITTPLMVTYCLCCTDVNGIFAEVTDANLK